jgi:hypothetical protein
MAANSGAQFSDAFDGTFASDAVGNNIFLGRNVLQGLVNGIDDFAACRQPRWRREHSEGAALLGSSFLLDDDEFLKAVEKLAGACVVISKMERAIVSALMEFLHELVIRSRNSPSCRSSWTGWSLVVRNTVLTGGQSKAAARRRCLDLGSDAPARFVVGG